MWPLASATALAMWLCGLGDPVLWGAVAFLLDYVPILGPMIGVVTFLIIAGLLTAKTLWPALLPAGLYFIIHLVMKARQLHPCCWRDASHSILSLSSWRLSSGIGCGVCLAPSS